MPKPSDSRSPGKDPQIVDAAPTVSPEENFRRFWEKNSKTVYAGCVVVLLAISGKAAYNSYAEHRREVLGNEYKAADKANKLQAFISDHPGEPLSGLAELTLADQAYNAAKYSEAQSGYQRAADILKTGPLAGRAELGAATSNVYLSKTDAALDTLRRLANDAAQLKGIRAEAAYKVASLDVNAGKNDEAVKFLDLTNQIDPSSNWAQQGMMLRSTLPASLTAEKKPAEVSIKPTLTSPAKP